MASTLNIDKLDAQYVYNRQCLLLICYLLKQGPLRLFALIRSAVYHYVCFCACKYAINLHASKCTSPEYKLINYKII